MIVSFKTKSRYVRYAVFLLGVLGGVFLLIAPVLVYDQQQGRYEAALSKDKELQKQILDLHIEAENINSELIGLKSSDPYKVNEELQASIAAVRQAFSESSDIFERQSDLVRQGVKVDAFLEETAKVMSLLSEFKYIEAREMANTINKEMDAAVAEVVAKQNTTPSVNLVTSNTPPGSGYARQVVSTDRGQFTVAMVVADEASTSVIVDTAAEADCKDNCPALPLSDYVARNGGFAGINGSYFCPPDYARCQGKINSYDTLVMNGRTKTVFNQGNNVYSTVPLVVAYGGKLSFYRRTLEWGPDSASTGAIANHPLLVSGGSNVVNEGALEAYQRDNKATRGFIGIRGGQIIIGHVLAATVGEAATVLQSLGLDQAINLDGGGSTALWSGGYKLGPGRALPSAIILK